ncbi:hypothetical protein TREMEDRAFT_68341 [Tremella mesenterica DSM 1558]|uniref:uncharacterized protein n=1 Tax=Tremella mesenterica (strain ATCC 24925 / CBS 8224 / DSM 1558 / NBRC 9311 / NRRL Y-6157 / RJB 2259-6 / UBC 559-6) TaxID=578456 RepID=UPI0003F49E26|nr:uncharacterized protein TREMEDRAFT_68341 [Tremella mesenterica DSM 1558]EIW69874.1 hypothetical protein TREMEDRAFT_68341 [Tremella mesenterica DSM 1558]
MVEEQPRRGSRARKQVERYSKTVENGKRKQVQDEHEDESPSEEEEGDEDSEHEVTPRPLKTNKRVLNGVTPKSTGTKQAKRSKKTIAGVAEVNDDVETNMNGDINGDGIKTDSNLFNAILAEGVSSDMIESWIEDYQNSADDETSEKSAVHQLVLLFIRCCGLKSTIEPDESVDQDGIADVLETIQDESVKTTLAVYPLISKAKPFRLFRNNLNVFITHFIKNLSLTPLLFESPETTSHTSPLINVLLAWLHTMSSSPLRSIRHTSTYITLKINSALCDVAAEVSKDLSLRQRQRETEEKKAGKNGVAQRKLKEAEEKVKEAHERKTTLEAFMKEIFDVLFVHRSRDADPAIRTDCLKELGVWVKKYPEEYVSSSYLVYFTRGCNDPNSHARLETAKALAALYSKETFVNNARTVTSRLLPRLVEMALRDVDLSVRVNALSTIALIDKTGILQDEDEERREQIARLVFDQEPRVRKAVGGFVRGVWEERVEKFKAEQAAVRGAKKKRASGITDDNMEKNLSWKALADLLVESFRALDQMDGEPSTSRHKISFPLPESVLTTRANAAVEALWADFEELRDWEGLVDYLLLDHSTWEDDAWLLDEDQENFMLQLLVACIKKEEKDEDKDERTKTLMKILPRLFTKHQADVARMAGILVIPEQMNLSLYLDMRKSAAYDQLWDDVTKQFLQHSDINVLTAAIKAVNHLCSNASMSPSNTTKMNELQEALLASLRDAIDGEDVATFSIDEDKVAALEAILLRIALLARSRDIVSVMEDEEGGQSSGWEIVCAFAERGAVGYKEEAKLVEHALHVIFVHISWLFKRFSADDINNDDKVSDLRDKRDRVLDTLRRLALRDKTNTSESVSRQAFVYFINLHILFSSRNAKSANAHPAVKACPLSMADELQHRLGGSFQAMVDRYASDREESSEEEQVEFSGMSAERVEEELLFLQAVSAFVGAIRCGVLDVEHAKEPLAYFGQFGQTYDAVVRKLVDVLKDEGIYNRESDTVQHVSASALQSSFSNFLETESTEPTATISLARLLASAFIIYGTHFSVLRQIHPNDIYDLHLSLLSYVQRRLISYISSERSTKSREAKQRFQQNRHQALTFFKPLILLITPVTPQDAVKLRRRIKEMEKELGVEVTGHKAWDPWKAYEKKLVQIANRDPQAKAAIEDNEQGQGEATDGDEQDVPVRPAKRQRQMTQEPEDRSNEQQGNEEEEEVENEQESEVEEERGDLSMEDLHLDNEEIDLAFDDGAMGMDVDLDLDDVLGPNTQNVLRERSLSVEPGARRKRRTRY